MTSQCTAAALSLTFVYGIKTDNTHSGLFLQVLQLALLVATYSTVDLKEEREVRLGSALLLVIQVVMVSSGGKVLVHLSASLDGRQWKAPCSMVF